MTKVKDYEDIERKYWRISDVARALSVPASRLRWWEACFMIYTHRKKSRRERSYGVDDVGKMAMIVRLMQHLKLKSAKRIFWRGQSEEILAILENGKTTQSVEFDAMEGHPMMICKP